MQLLVAHSLGIVGELLNLFGAILLGVDLFLHGKFRQKEAELGLLHDFAVRNRLSSVRFMSIRVALPDFKDLIAERRARKFGFAGAFFLMAGFALLVGYHSVEIWHLASTCQTQ